MTGSLQVEADLSGLNNLVSALNGALIGTGSGDGDLHRLLKIEAGQLAWEISKQVGPKKKETLEKAVEREAKQFITSKPVFSNLEPDQQYSSTGDFTWLAAGPSFLLGINDEDNQVGASADDALQFIRAGQRSGGRGKAYLPITNGQGAHWMRGGQHLMRLNRTRVSSAAYSGAIRKIKDKFGQLRASFAYTASKLIPGKAIPEWVSRHFATRAGGKALFNDSGLTSQLEPFIEFGSTAPGVETNSRTVAAIANAVETRKYITRSKLEKILRGYAYDWNSGRVFNRREAQDQN